MSSYTLVDFAPLLRGDIQKSVLLDVLFIAPMQLARPLPTGAFVVLSPFVYTLRAI